MRDLKALNICGCAPHSSKGCPSNRGRKFFRSLAVTWRFSITERAEDVGCKGPSWRIAIGIHWAPIIGSQDSSISVPTFGIPSRRLVAPSAHLFLAEALDGWLLASSPCACSTNIFSNEVSSSVAITTVGKGITGSMIEVRFSSLPTSDFNTTIETWMSPLIGAGGLTNKTLACLLWVYINSSFFKHWRSISPPEITINQQNRQRLLSPFDALEAQI